MRKYNNNIHKKMYKLILCRNLFINSKQGINTLVQLLDYTKNCCPIHKKIQFKLKK